MIGSVLVWNGLDSRLTLSSSSAGANQPTITHHCYVFQARWHSSLNVWNGFASALDFGERSDSLAQSPINRRRWMESGEKNRIKSIRYVGHHVSCSLNLLDMYFLTLNASGRSLFSGWNHGPSTRIGVKCVRWSCRSFTKIPQICETFPFSVLSFHLRWHFKVGVVKWPPFCDQPFFSC